MGHTLESSEAICVEQEESLSEEAVKEAVEERKMPDRRVLRKKLDADLEEKWEYRYKPENKYTEEEVRELRAEAKIAKKIATDGRFDQVRMKAPMISSTSHAIVKKVGFLFIIQWDAQIYKRLTDNEWFGNSSTARGIALLLLHRDLTLHM